MTLQPGAFAVNIATKGDWNVVRIQGDVTTFTARKLCEVVTAMYQGESFREEGSFRWVALDLTEVLNLDEYGTQVLMTLQKRAMRNGAQRMAIVASGEPRRRIDRTACLMKHYEHFDVLTELLQQRSTTMVPA